jgi:Na+/H+-dicarboxylate symporter
METLTILFFAALIGIALAARMTAERVAREERSRVRIPVRVEEPEPRRDNLY